MKTITRTIRTIILVLAAGIASFAGMASARTMTMMVNRSADGIPESFDFAFSNVGSGVTNALYLACGYADGGTESFAGWKGVRQIALVPGDTTALVGIPAPDDLGVGASHMRFFLTSGNADIPGAEMLDYIKANSNVSNAQYVMTEFTPSEKSAAEIDFKFHSSSGNQCFFSARGIDTNVKSFSLFWLGGTDWRWDYEVPGTRQPGGSPGGTRHVIRADSSGLVVDGGTVSGTKPAAATFTAAGSMSILCSNAGGTINNNQKCRVDLYSFKAWRDGSNTSSLVLDLVPCRKQDGTVCLYNRVDGTFLENKGEGAFTGGNVVSTSSFSVEATSDLVTVPLLGWVTTTGTCYPYVNPLYIVDVAEGSSNSIDQVASFKMVETAHSSTTTEVSYAQFIGTSRTGTIIKRGGGTLTFNRDLSSFTGPVHIEEGVGIGVCSNCFGHTVTANAGPNQRTYVHSGATVVMDATNIGSRNPEANAIYYEGEGHPGMGGAFVMRIGAWDFTRWPLGAGSQAVGPAYMFVDIPSSCKIITSAGNATAGAPPSNFSAGGQDILVYGRNVDSIFGPDNNSITDIGNLVVSNMTVITAGSGAALRAKNGNASTIRFTAGSRWHWETSDSGANQEYQTATVYIDDVAFVRFQHGTDGYGVDPWNDANKTRNWYRGPMVLNDDFRIYNRKSPRNVVFSPGEEAMYYGCTFSAKVSGPKGFRPFFRASVNKHCGDNMRLNLLYPTNTFAGGIVMDGGSLGVWAERAVPSQEGAGLVSITNGYVYFGRKGPYPSTTKWPVFEMPVTEFVGSGAVTNGTGTWQGLVKKDAGTLDYNSQLGGAYLDLQGGKVKFNTQYREAYTGENATYAPDGYAAALPAFTTLKGTEGTLDLEDAGGTYTVTNVEGTPSVTNGNLTVTGEWTIDAATLSARSANISGTLAFGEGASITVTGNLSAVKRPDGGFVIAKAANITGWPRLYCNGRSLMVSDGKLILSSAFMIIFR